MATQTTSDSTVVVPEGQTPPVVTQTPDGTVITFGGDATGGTVDANAFRTIIEGGTLRLFNFNVANGAILRTEGNTTKDSETFGDDGRQRIVADDSKVVRSIYDMGDGKDSIVFKNDSVVKNSEFLLGDGRDSVRLSGKIKDSAFDLGADTVKDTINIDGDAKVDNLVIRNFTGEDELIIGGETYTASDIVDGKIPGIDFISFE